MLACLLGNHASSLLIAGQIDFFARRGFEPSFGPQLSRHSFGESAGPGLIVALVLALIGVLLLWHTKRQERRNFIARRAPRLPIRALSEHDDAWIAGRVTLDDPLICPHFGTRCVYYSYAIERRVTRTVRDSKGRTRTVTSWNTEYSESNVSPFWLLDDTSGIYVEGPKARFEGLPSTGYDYTGFSRRHHATMLPVGIDVHALGVKVEGDRFGPLAKVPLIVTTQTHQEYLRSGSRNEGLARWFGMFLLLAACICAASMLFTVTWRQPNWPLGVGIGIAVWSPLWFWSTYNLFVRRRHATEAAWRQIDVDLGVRFEVVPKIVEVAKAHAKHEGDLFEQLARMRNEKDADTRETIRNERRRSAAVRSLLALSERYPDLRSNELFTNLHDKLWALEEKIAASREFYDRNALEWNGLVESFPSNLVAKLFGYDSRAYFGANPDERRVTRVKLASESSASASTTAGSPAAGRAEQS